MLTWKLTQGSAVEDYRTKPVIVIEMFRPIRILALNQGAEVSERN